MGKNKLKSPVWEYKGKKDLVIPVDMSPYEALRLIGVPFNPNTKSGYIRPLNAPYGVKNSWHKKGWKGSKVYGSAVDLTPAPGYTYDDILRAMAHPALQEWVKANGFGILDERPASVRVKTHGTGPHLHFGPSKNNSYATMTSPHLGYWDNIGMKHVAQNVEKALEELQSSDQDNTVVIMPAEPLYDFHPLYKDYTWTDELAELTKVPEEEKAVTEPEYNSAIQYLLPYLFSDIRQNDFVKPKDKDIQIRISADGGPLNLFKKGSKISRYKSDNDWEKMYELSKPIYQKFIKAGIDPRIAVAVLGNIALESSFNHKASNRTHWGYVQNDRTLTDYVTSNYGGYGHEQQIQYLIDGLTKGIKGSDKGTGKAIQKRFTNFLNAAKGLKDPADIAALWDKHYEISGGLGLYDRKNYATKFWNKYNVPNRAEVILESQPQPQEMQYVYVHPQPVLQIEDIPDMSELVVHQPEILNEKPSLQQLAIMSASPDLYAEDTANMDLIKELFEPLGIKHTSGNEEKSPSHDYKIRMSFAEGGMVNIDKDAVMSDYDTWARYMANKTDVPLYNFYGEGGLESTFRDNPEEAYEMLSSEKEHPKLKEWKALNNIDYVAIPDTTFTRDKTKQGDIDVFSAENLGNYYDFDKNTKQYRYYKLNPIPGKDVILYNPNTNDEQDVRLDVLHLMPKLDDTYNTLNLLYREAAKNGDPGYWAKLYYKQDVKEKGKDNIDSEEQYFNNEADGLLRNMFIEGSPEYIESKRYRSDKDNLIRENEYLIPYINNILRYLESGLKPEWIQTRDDNGNILNSKLLDEIVVKNANGGKINKYDDGGITYLTPNIEEQALLRAQLAKGPKSNYEDAVDFDVNPISKLKVLTDKGVSNCMLTASQFYNPNRPISGIRTVLADPKNNGFYQVNEKHAVPGTLVIASIPGVQDNMQSPRHAMMLSGYANKDYNYQFKGKTYKVKKGDPLVTYSRGKRTPDEYVKNVPLSAYIDNSYGKSEVRYFRPFNDGFPAKLLPEVVVTPLGSYNVPVDDTEAQYYNSKVQRLLQTMYNTKNQGYKNYNPNDNTYVTPKYRDTLKQQH